MIDLHVHSTASDGALEPQTVIDRAQAAGVRLLALTDHDTLAGHAGLAAPAGLDLVCGIEFSTTWRRQGIHVVGLHVDPGSEAMRAACVHQGAARTARAHDIAEYLRRRGIADAYAGAAALAGEGAIGRPHFAAYLLACGAVSSLQQAYRKYLKRPREASAAHRWASLAMVIDWIRGAGGNAVLAHPLHYRLTRLRLDELAGEFAAAGGAALEVVSGRQSEAGTLQLAQLARAHGLAASVGTDFHRPSPGQDAPGVRTPLPRGLRPVWDAW